jgi:hypothetical protein
MVSDRVAHFCRARTDFFSYIHPALPAACGAGAAIRCEAVRLVGMRRTHRLLHLGHSQRTATGRPMPGTKLSTVPC